MDISNRATNKTREISVFTLFEILQQEYIVCELRSKIYPLEKHRKYWSDIMNKKKEKILDIASRNSLMCIFHDERIKRDVSLKIIPEVGYPNFIYRDDRQKLMQEKWDLHNYYSIGSEFSVMRGELSSYIGKLSKVDFNHKTVVLQSSLLGEAICSFHNITRIL